MCGSLQQICNIHFGKATPTPDAEKREGRLCALEYLTDARTGDIWDCTMFCEYVVRALLRAAVGCFIFALSTSPTT
jgi:hypothetical protein